MVRSILRHARRGRARVQTKNGGHAIAIHNNRRLFSSVQSALHASSGQQVETSEPSFISRPVSVTDGKWDSADAQAVDVALQVRQQPALTRSLARSIARSLSLLVSFRSQDAERIARLGVKAGINSREVLLGQRAVDLEALAVETGQPKYRAKQLTDAIYRKGVRAVDEIHNIPKAWKEALAARGVTVGRSELHHKVVSSCGTIKYLLKLVDGYVVETVGIPERDGNRLTVCVSSEVGCPMRCTFCATGKGGFARNLMPHEIVDQVLLVQEEFGKRVRCDSARWPLDLLSHVPIHPLAHVRLTPPPCR